MLFEPFFHCRFLLVSRKLLPCGSVHHTGDLQTVHALEILNIVLGLTAEVAVDLQNKALLPEFPLQVCYFRAGVTVL